ncbi:hypothetical protein AC1031_014619 [Aphanomyces cochlioides]|nr:hypothetical protein AC1031_014619 [Aphanomyces cochlioides]
MLKRYVLIIMAMSSVLEHFCRESCRIKMKIPAGVTFDLDDTLWCGKTVLKKASKSLHGHLTSTYPRITPEVFQTHWTQVMAATESRDFSALRREALRQSAQSQNYDAETVVKSGMEAFLSARSSPDLFDGVEAMLSALQVDYASSLFVMQWGYSLDISSLA